MRYSTVRLATLFCGVASLTALAACGLITAGVSVPEAFAHNNDLGLKGTILDDRGTPIDDVLVTVRREYYLWHADRSYSEFDSLYFEANHQFDLAKRRAHELTFIFHKPGYLDQTVVVAQHFIRADTRWIEGDQWPLDTPIRVVMFAQNRPAAPLNLLALQIDYTDPAKFPVIDLSKAIRADTSSIVGAHYTDALSILPGASAAAPPPHTLYATIERQPTRTTGPERRVDPLDLNLPARVIFHIADPDAGFILDTPAAGTHPLSQMTQAPESGYLPELALTDTRLRTMRDPASHVISDRSEFFYFRAHGQYGKGVVSWADSSDPTSVCLSLALMLQPDGTRNLASRMTP